MGSSVRIASRKHSIGEQMKNIILAVLVAATSINATAYISQLKVKGLF